MCQSMEWFNLKKPFLFQIWSYEILNNIEQNEKLPRKRSTDSLDPLEPSVDNILRWSCILGKKYLKLLTVIESQWRAE